MTSRHRYPFVLGSLAALLFPLAARAQSSGDTCAQARACCDAMAQASGGHMSAASCAAVQRVSASPQAAASCPQMLAQFQTLASTMASRMGGSVPAACAGGSTPTPGAPSQPPGQPPSAPGGSSDTGANPNSTPPSPPPPVIPPDPPAPRSSTGLLSCEVERSDHHRALLTHSSTTLTVRCSGIPTASNPSGSGAPVTPPVGDTGHGSRVQIDWSLAGQPAAGQLAPNGATAQYTAPARAPHPASVTVNVRVRLLDRTGRVLDDARLPRTIFVLDRDYALQFDTLYRSTCRPVSQGTAAGAYDLTCSNLRENFSIQDDWTIRSTGAGSCTNTLPTGFQPCVPNVTGGEATGQDTITNITGEVDPDSALATLHLEGQRWGMPQINSMGRTNVNSAHPVPILMVPIPVGLEDGWTRTLGSAAPNFGGFGGTTTFTVHTR